MTLPPSDIQALAFAMMSEAQEEEEEYNDEISIDQLTNVLVKHEGLVEGLTVSLAKWLVPPKKEKKKDANFWKSLKETWEMRKKKVQAAWQLYAFLGFIFGMNGILFITRAYYFRGMLMLDPEITNVFYMLSRACGRCLNFSSMMIIVLVLRYTITKCRDVGLSNVLPLDHNIYLHKVTGIVIFCLAWLHTIMHLCNFAINVQPNPVQFVQMNSEYWTVPIQREADPLHHEGILPKWQYLGYKLPDNCFLLELKHAKMTAKTEQLCENEINLMEKLNISNGVCSMSKMTHCEVSLHNHHANVTRICSEEGNAETCQHALNEATECNRWSAADWIFTPRPGVFGLAKGFASITGVVLIIILTVMVICSLPIVRKSGHFQVFYFTHLLFIVYLGLLIIHAPEFWKWIFIPGLIYIVERIYRTIATTVGSGKSHIVEGNVLPSSVTELVIKKPDTFKHSAGDWVFVKVPQIAQFEWHPFTISSAPERRDAFTLHIRGVGNWTKRLYSHFENVKAESGRKSRSQSIQSRRKSRGKSLKEKNVGKSQTTLQTQMLKEATSKIEVQKNGHDGFIDGHGQTHHVIDGFENKITSAENMKLEIFIDGPFGAPASNIFRAEHAVLIATGIGVTPFSAILQSIMNRYKDIKRECPRCNLKWNDDIAAHSSSQNLKKVDFFWINRDQKALEWFIKLLNQMEEEQAGDEAGGRHKFMDVHIYLTAALQKTDMRAIALQTAIDILHKKENRDVTTGLKTKTQAGRPNWEKAFQKIRDENHGKVTVFYCGNPFLAKTLKTKCEDYGFNFRKEVF